MSIPDLKLVLNACLILKKMFDYQNLASICLTKERTFFNIYNVAKE